MNDPFRKVRPGDDLRIPASAYNGFVDAARSHARPDAGAGVRGPSGDIVPMANDTGSDLPIYAVVGIGGPLFDPNDDEDAFLRGVALRGVVPTADHARRFAILTEPLPAGRVGPGLVFGVVQARVDVSDGSHGCAVAAAGDTRALASAASGPAQILWREGGTGEQWAIVRRSASCRRPAPPPPEPVSCSSALCQIPGGDLRLHVRQGVNTCTSCSYSAFTNLWTCVGPYAAYDEGDIPLVYYPSGSHAGWDRPVWGARFDTGAYLGCGCRATPGEQVAAWYALYCHPTNNRWELRRFAVGTAAVPGHALCDKSPADISWPACDCYFSGGQLMDSAWPTLPGRTDVPWELVFSISAGTSCPCLDVAQSGSGGDEGFVRVYDQRCASAETMMVATAEGETMALADVDAGRLPSLMAMAADLGRAVGCTVARAARGEAVRASPEERARRLDLCHACPELRGVRCGACGCYVAAKTALAGERCPIGKW